MCDDRQANRNDSTESPRSGWDEAFRRFAECRNDDDFADWSTYLSDWDDKEWVWDWGRKMI
jgi:hypothetical protein